jgi:isopentenyl phosphate kinase
VVERELVLVKVGGSLLTHKAHPRSVNRLGMTRVCEAFAHTTRKLAIVHGAGSFGHFHAKRARLGVAPKYAGAEEIGEVHHAMLELDLRFLECLREHRVPAYPFAAGPAFHARGLTPIATTFLQSLLAAELVPVTFGDVIAHPDGKASILSGDVLIRHLAAALRPARVVFALDVDGVYATPGRRDTLIARLSATAVGRVATRRVKMDVTGGLALKLREGRTIAQAGVDVAFLGGHHSTELLAAIEGRRFRGTFMPGVG